MFSDYRAVVMVHRCFWHRDETCRYAKVPATRTVVWLTKLEGNRKRDQRVLEELVRAGWRFAVVWECGLRGPQADTTIEIVARWLEFGESCQLLARQKSRAA